MCCSEVEARACNGAATALHAHHARNQVHRVCVLRRSVIDIYADTGLRDGETRSAFDPSTHPPTVPPHPTSPRPRSPHPHPSPPHFSPPFRLPQHHPPQPHPHTRRRQFCVGPQAIQFSGSSLPLSVRTRPPRRLEFLTLRLTASPSDQLSYASESAGVMADNREGRDARVNGDGAVGTEAPEKPARLRTGDGNRTSSARR